MGQISKDAVTVITSNTRFPPSRRPPWAKSPAERLHIRHVGEIVHAWNQAHGMLFHVFSVVIVDGDIELAHAIWHTTQSDKGQREMLDAAVRVKFPSPTNSYRTAILWALSAMSDLGTHRNDAVHAQILGGHPEPLPGLSVRTSVADRLELSSVSNHWRLMRGDLYAIFNYLDGIYLGLWQQFPRPLSRRPKLQFARTVSASSQNRSRRKKRQARERQRQSS